MSDIIASRPTDIPSEKWVEWEKDFERDKPPEYKMMVMAVPEMAAVLKELFLSGCWLEDELIALKCDRDLRKDILFSQGQRSLGQNPWLVARRALDEYLAGQHIPAGKELAEALLNDASLPVEVVGEETHDEA